MYSLPLTAVLPVILRLLVAGIAVSFMCWQKKQSESRRGPGEPQLGIGGPVLGRHLRIPTQNAVLNLSKMCSRRQRKNETNMASDVGHGLSTNSLHFSVRNQSWLQVPAWLAKSLLAPLPCARCYTKNSEHRWPIDKSLFKTTTA